MLAATICNYIKASPATTPFAKCGPMTFGLREAPLMQPLTQEKPTPLTNSQYM
jgi:hypothetical protein